MVSRGVWHLLADRTCMWSLSIVTPGAFSHVVVFRWGFGIYRKQQSSL